ncbi:MAG: hypothetical protein ACJ796_07940 [Gemmatimonadaceae bacterium]
MRIGNRGAIRSGSFIEATLRDLAAPGLGDQRRELGIRIKRFIYENGDIADVFAGGEAAPNDTMPTTTCRTDASVSSPSDGEVHQPVVTTRWSAIEAHLGSGQDVVTNQLVQLVALIKKDARDYRFAAATRAS